MVGYGCWQPTALALHTNCVSHISHCCYTKGQYWASGEVSVQPPDPRYPAETLAVLR